MHMQTNGHGGLLCSGRTGGAVRGGSIVVRISGDEAASGDDNELWRIFAILLVI